MFCFINMFLLFINIFLFFIDMFFLYKYVSVLYRYIFCTLWKYFLFPYGNISCFLMGIFPVFLWKYFLFSYGNISCFFMDIFHIFFGNVFSLYGYAIPILYNMTLLKCNFLVQLYMEWAYTEKFFCYAHKKALSSLK